MLANAKPTEPNGPEKLTQRQEQAIGALLTEATHKAAAEKVGVTAATLCRWLHRSAFREAYRQVRREMVEAATGRIQAASSQAFETLLLVAREGRREGGRVAVARIQLGQKGLASANDM